MYRFLLLFLFLSLSLYADKKVEVFATTVDTNGSYLKASDEVVVLYDGMYLSAQTATYDKNTEILELYGQVHALKDAQYYAMGDYLLLDTQRETRQFRPFFLQEYQDKLWISARSAKSIDQEYELHTGLVSSCNPQEPDWTLRFSSGYYDGEDQWMQLYNARLYAGEVPVFYFPYIAYPTDTTRRTGLLRPTFGLSAEEGFMYEQGIFIAEDPQWDLELLPQVRTKRGEGLYNTFRFVDSPGSFGSITVGGFQEKKSYQEQFNLLHDKHYGVEFDYEHRGFLGHWFNTNIQGDSGIYSDITYLNDVEYLNLQKNDTLEYSINSQVTSRINLFLNQSENYFGMYSKYFIDLNKESNAATIQNLPELHYHSYLNTLLDDSFLYLVDYRGSNFYREEGKNATQHELNVPLDLQFTLLDEYLTLTLSENIYATGISFHGPNDNVASKGYDTGTYARDYQKVELNTNLVKAFDSFTHSVSLSAAYVHPGAQNRTGFYEDYQEKFQNDVANNIPCVSGPCEYNTINKVLEEASLELTQFVFTPTGQEKIYHRLRQPLIYEDGYDKYGELENELRYYITGNLNYYNNTFYNHQRNVISKTQNTLGYNNSVFTFNASHLYQDKLVNTQRVRSRYLTTNARYNYSSRWQYFAGYAYDIENSETKNRNIGFLFKKQCWNLQLQYVENIRPILDASRNTSSIKDSVVYLTLNLNPLGGFEVDYKTSE